MNLQKVMLWVGRGALALLLLAILSPIALFAAISFLPPKLPTETAKRLYDQYRNVNRRDGSVDMVPDFFQGGELKQDIEHDLLEAGLEKWTSSRPVPLGAASVDVFKFDAGSQGMFCGNELFLEIAYDKADELHSAIVSQEGACL